MRLDNRVAIVTGSGRGIGRVIALRLASEGASVIVASKSRENAESVSAEIKSEGGRAFPVVCDVSEENAVTLMVETSVSLYGKIDILVNNVGIRGPIANVVDMDLSGWEYTIATNLTGTMLCSREVLREMIPRRTGTIVNISSDLGRRGYPSRSAYICTKWAQIALTQTMAQEVAELGIRVNCVCPGTVEGRRINDLIEAQSIRLGVARESYRKKLEAAAAMKRLVTADEVAEAVLFLVSDEASAITGQSLNVCGGTVFN